MVSPKASRAIPTLPHTSRLGWHLYSHTKVCFPSNAFQGPRCKVSRAEVESLNLCFAYTTHHPAARHSTRHLFHLTRSRSRSMSRYLSHGQAGQTFCGPFLLLSLLSLCRTVHPGDQACPAYDDGGIPGLGVVSANTSHLYILPCPLPFFLDSNIFFTKLSSQALVNQTSQRPYQLNFLQQTHHLWRPTSFTIQHNTTHNSKPNSSNTEHTMASRYSSSKPVVHQAPASISSAYSASTGSYASSRGSSTPRSISPSDEAYLRVYGADQHRAAIKENSGVTIINRKQSGYDAHAPSPHYGGGYSRH
ncbi:uncharacterized protein BDZ83DRAFT_454590 [Colletotrichum acutatum]|uniref:Uncharacterized protein n=2 Tax=Colletotrichum acutatum species complex TaxID=2707335 RepID=A0AAD8XD23_GLOAC|nr:uncharacterized protein BDZ83DRAFT_454590 [Colletotrichum acutatum]KAK1720330.1 hypothetical protein BDZ83DRAFT_454590 [Colletotrichum acutatum]